jgi:pimeloyl-ACP methyl ester carboxylesterase
MKMDIRFQRGDRGKPLVIFIHGMGMNVSSWTEPSSARILGGKYPLKVLISRKTAKLETSFTDLNSLGFPVLSWTQSRPAGPIQSAVDELTWLMKEYAVAGNSGIVLIGHSRGGLVGRKALEEAGRIRGMVTMATPHHGTNMARLAAYLSPAAIMTNRLLQRFTKQDLTSAITRILGFFCSEGLTEMLPGSSFFSNLRDTRFQGSHYVSVGGTNPDLLQAMNLPFTEIATGIIPSLIIPEEMRSGYGDGIVTAASSVLPYGDEHRDFPVNHAEVLFNKDVREYVIKKILSF